MEKQYQNSTGHIYMEKQYQTVPKLPKQYQNSTKTVPVTKSVASLHGLRLVVWPKFGTNPARVAFGPLWLFNQNYGTGTACIYYLKHLAKF